MAKDAKPTPKKKPGVAKKKPAAKKKPTVKKVSKKPVEERETLPEEPKFVPPMTEVHGVPVMTLTREHLMELELAHMKVREADSLLMKGMAEAAEDEMASKIRVNNTRIQAAQHGRDRMKFEDAAKRLVNKLSRLYGVNFKNVMYDTESGIIDMKPTNEERKAWKKEGEEPKTK